VDHHTSIEHAVPRCTSSQLYHGVLDDSARAVFNGRILVRADAQQTDAHQINRNLLLSREAHVDTKPQLEIFADDVRCTHGATVGQLDRDALFYLKSRGLSPLRARSMLTFGFMQGVLQRMSLDPVRKRLERTFGAELL
jgi:Fe-S cluster assembly protein SufD